jgi:putative membrane protein
MPLIIFAVVLAILNTILKPVLKIITLPINLITLGLFTIVINAAMVLLAARIVNGFSVEGFIPALIFGVALAVIDFFLRIKD